MDDGTAIASELSNREPKKYSSWFPKAVSASSTNTPAKKAASYLTGRSICTPSNYNFDTESYAFTTPLEFVKERRDKMLADNIPDNTFFTALNE